MVTSVSPTCKTRARFTCLAESVWGRAFVVCVLPFFLFACASSTPGTTADQAAAPSTFGNFLVVGVAGNYNSRAQFERTVAAALRREGASATTYYSAVGGNKPVSAEDVRGLIAAGGFDAVMITRILDTDTRVKVNKDRTETEATPIGGRLVNFFRFNYTDTTKPASLDLKTRITFVTEVYSAATEEVVWSMESTSRRQPHVGLLIDDTADAVMRGLLRTDLIRG